MQSTCPPAETFMPGGPTLERDSGRLMTAVADIVSLHICDDTARPISEV